ncbi:MAG: hypothetical protein H0T62_12550 [Parachlamydiaceae bacterium]|nr:hypothetical protein [Parachlamydiaceae bacterium]
MLSKTDYLHDINCPFAPEDMDYFNEFSKSFVWEGDASNQSVLRGRKIESQVFLYDFSRIHNEKYNYVMNSKEKIQTEISDLAAKAFFEFVYRKTNTEEFKYPLSKMNKCIGFAASAKSPHKVYCAFSQDSITHEDREPAQKLNKMLAVFNRENLGFELELVNIPTNFQHIAMRSLGQNLNEQANNELTQPRSRCAEPALLIALNKAGSVNKVSDIHLSTFGAIPWKNKYKLGVEDFAIKGFEKPVRRNITYLGDDNVDYLILEVGQNEIGYLDRWKPCACHCEQFFNNMIAVAIAGNDERGRYRSPTRRFL